MTTQHPINQLTDHGLDELRHRIDLTYMAINGAYQDDQRDQAPVMERCLRILPTDLFNELQAYLGSVKDHVGTIAELLYGQPHLLALDGFVTDESANAYPCSDCGKPTSEHGLVGECPTEPAPVASEAFDLSIYTERYHPCVDDDCDALVAFDDEPWCFTHSPDEGSSVRGYSWQRVQGISTVEHIERHHRLSAQLQRGLITSAEFQAALSVLVFEAHGLDEVGLPR